MDVIDTVIVAALVNGNEGVEVVDAEQLKQPSREMADNPRMLHFQKLDVYQRSMECASHLDVMQLDELVIEAELYGRGMGLLARGSGRC